MILDIQILDKSLCKGINGRYYLNFNIVHQLRVSVSDIYSAAPTTHTRRYSLKSHWGRVLHMYEGTIQLELMERFYKGMKSRMPEYSDRNKLVIPLVVN